METKHRMSNRCPTAFLVPAFAHAGLIVLGDRLPEGLAPVIAGSVYLPLVLLHGLGLPVFGAAESGGWPAPSIMGWTLVALIWSSVWWLLFAAVDRLLMRPT
jgi:hypothetical protein